MMPHYTESNHHHGKLDVKRLVTGPGGAAGAIMNPKYLISPNVHLGYLHEWRR